MHVADKLDLLTAGASYDLACACSGSNGRTRGPLGRWIYPASLPDGRKIPLLKVLLSNACTRNCIYCAQRRGRNFARSSFRPQELASAFMDMHAKGLVGGLFLSSAIADGVEESMEAMIRTVELVRFRHGYKGWLHLKILPGSSHEQVERASRLASRLSLNLEAPTAERLSAISPQKRFIEDIYERMGWIRRLIDSEAGRCRGQTTQFVVGAGEETDGEFIRLAGRLYGGLNLSRVYYSAFQPVAGTPLARRPPATFEREHRLYQVDFLLRRYGFGVDEIVLDENDNLPCETDPKSAWASRHPEFFPVEINTAAKELLLRVPGIGPIAAGRIITRRENRKLKTLADLKRLRAVAARAAPFILLDGKRRDGGRRTQLSLFDRAAGY